MTSAKLLNWKPNESSKKTALFLVYRGGAN